MSTKLSSTSIQADPARPVRVALAGNPNCGKTSLFNALTGSRQHVANYPGATVERREGRWIHGGRPFQVLDLPGTYSLTSYSPEERIAEREILGAEHDVVIVVADATTLGRSLVLLAQTMLAGARTVLCLNMMDEAERAGLDIDTARMAELLRMPVVRTVGHRGHGTPELMAAVAQVAASPPNPADPSAGRVTLGPELHAAVDAVIARLGSGAPPRRDLPWLATQLLVGETEGVAQLLGRDHDLGPALAEAGVQRARLQAITGLEVDVFVTDRLYGFVAGLLRAVVRRQARPDGRAASDRIDTILVHPRLGVPIFAGVMYLLFWLTFTVGEAPMGWIEAGFGALGAWISGLWPAGSESPLRSLLVDGVIAGVGGVTVFLPNILLLFGGLAVLEDSGYMARAAFLLDRVMQRFHLHGRAFLPLMTGFGCTVPGIMATRVLDDERDRLTTMMVLPLMSCGARLPIWMLLIPAFFPSSWRAPVLFGIYAFGVALGLGLARLLRRTLLSGEDAPFVMELPPYRLPTLRSLVSRTLERGFVYLKKAGTVILGLSILMWLATSYPKSDATQIDADIAAGRVQIVELDLPAGATAEQQAQALALAAAALPEGVEAITAATRNHRRSAENLANSVAGRVGRALAVVLAPIGFDWKISTAVLGAFAAKEVFVSQMGIVQALGDGDSAHESLSASLSARYSVPVGLSLILFLLIATPCMATVAVTRRESGRWRWALLQFFGLTAIAYVLALVVYQVGRLFI